MLATAAAFMAMSAAQAQPVIPPKDTRIAWWREARLGLFIHWGLYAIPAGEWKGQRIGGTAEWILQNAKISVKEYVPLQSQFNPVQFDAKQWVSLAKEAGMKYIVITTKHHDGFCLFDTKTTDWDVMTSPFRRDIIRELADECRKQGIRLGFYYSIMDWHHPDWTQRRPWDPRPELPKPDMDRYTAYMKEQLRELLTNYGDVATVWFDGEWEAPWTHERGKDLYDFILRLQPNTLVNNRVDKGRDGMAGMTMGDHFRGDYGTPEQEIPATGFPGVDWESCMTMNDTWGYSKFDQNWKSAQKIVQQTVETASKGGNYLINVGPTAEGLIPTASVERLKALGAWLRVNGESVYGTSASPFRKSPFRWTKRSGTLYCHLAAWPGTSLQLPGVLTKIDWAELLTPSGPVALKLTQSESGLSLALPEKAPSELGSVIALRHSGELRVEDAGLTQASDGSVSLPAFLGTVHGSKVKLEEGWFGFWTEPTDWVSWDFEVKKPGRFQVEITYACEKGTEGSTFEVLTSGGSVMGTVQATQGWRDFRTDKLGPVELKAGRCTLAVRPVDRKGHALMNLKSVRLVP